MQPLTISYDEMKQLAKKIIDKRINWEYTLFRNYWLITISPDGEIIMPTSNTAGHPELAEEIIYPHDKILEMLFNYEYKDSYEPDSIDMSYFMIFYGYINIDGYGEDVTKMSCKYNPHALTVNTRNLPESIESYCEDMYSTNNKKHSMEKQIELSKKVPYFRKRILNLLEQYQLDREQIKELLNTLHKTEEEFLDGINEEYLKSKEQGAER